MCVCVWGGGGGGGGGCVCVCMYRYWLLGETCVVEGTCNSSLHVLTFFCYGRIFAYICHKPIYTAYAILRLSPYLHCSLIHGKSCASHTCICTCPLYLRVYTLMYM